MDHATNTVEITIPARHTYRVVGGDRIEIEVLTGQLWITREGETADYVVDPRGRFAIGSDKLVLLHAFGNVRALIRYPEAAAVPSVELRGGARAFGGSIARAMVAEAAQNVSARIAGALTRLTGRTTRLPAVAR